MFRIHSGICSFCMIFLQKGMINRGDFLKKLSVVLLLVLTVLLAAMIFDYQTNNRFVSAKLYQVCVFSYQEEMSFTAPILQYNNLFLMSGATRLIDNIYEGAAATVTCNHQTYQGYLWQLEPTFDGIFYATVLVTGITRPPSEDATAVILGSIRRDLIFIPKECLVTDDNGQDAVFVVQNGYAMLRPVETGELILDGKQQIRHGIFPAETIIVSPNNIRTGDRVLPS